LRGRTLLQAIFFDNLLYHGFILPYLAVEETVRQPRHNDFRRDQLPSGSTVGELAISQSHMLPKQTHERRGQPCHSLLAMRQRAPCTSRTTQPRAALSLGLPTILSTRRRLSANTGKLHSVRTFSSPRMKQSPASHHLCMVPNGCATCAWRRCMPSGRRRPRCALAARRGSSTHRVIRRPSWLRVHACLIAQALQTDIA